MKNINVEKVKTKRQNYFKRLQLSSRYFYIKKKG
nr:MAG TPA: hypothetical protein [Caudoviricetes sp.]